MDKYEKVLLNRASEYDVATGSCGHIMEMVSSVVREDDKDAAIAILRMISETLNSGDIESEIKRLAYMLKSSLIEYYGYVSIMEYASSKLSHQDENVKNLDELLEELNDLVGLDNVKTEVQNLIAYHTVQQLREKQNLHSQKSTMHMAFTGNPGTGKTTVARIVGRIYKQLGLLSKGHFCEVSRTDLIAGYQGQTALKVKKVIEKAKGGVLFIDEAYSITENDHADSYGRECLTELTKALEDYRDDLVVIVAGYTEPMKHFFSSNPGLKSRFNIFIEFPDYSAEELLKMLEKLSSKNDYMLDNVVIPRLRTFFEEQIENKDENFANGRLVRNIFDDLVMNHAKRIFKTARNTSDLRLLTVISSDDFQI